MRLSATPSSFSCGEFTINILGGGDVELAIEEDRCAYTRIDHDEAPDFLAALQDWIEQL